MKYSKIKGDVQLTQELLKTLLKYDPDTGDFTRLVRTPRRHDVGEIAGCKDTHGYVKISINCKIYKAHRLAFLYMDGYIPENDVDHINRIKDDNRWCNLREVSRSCNNRNTCISSNNTSGVRGVSFKKVSKNWRSIIYVDGENRCLGCFKDFDAAVMARWRGEKYYNFPDCCSDSSAYNYLKEKGIINE